MSIANPTPEEQSKAQREENDRSVRIVPVNNGFIIHTKQGKFVFATLKEMLDRLEKYFKGG